MNPRDGLVNESKGPILYSISEWTQETKVVILCLVLTIYFPFSQDFVGNSHFGWEINVLMRIQNNVLSHINI